LEKLGASPSRPRDGPLAHRLRLPQTIGASTVPAAHDIDSGHARTHPVIPRPDSVDRGSPVAWRNVYHPRWRHTDHEPERADRVPHA